MLLLGIFRSEVSSSSHHTMEDSKRGIRETFSASNLREDAAKYFQGQRVDHFDGTSNATWAQRYYVNDTFWKGPNSSSPVFLCVGGEGPAFDESVVVASVHCNVAVEYLEETGALMVALQHRYYGCHRDSTDSEEWIDCPVTSFAGKSRSESLKYLSSRQALEDLAAFRQHIVDVYELTEDNRWISFGGSYPGMLAAWTRLKYPHLFHGAVSSSAPVRAKVEMVVYNDIVAEAYAVESVGGSKLCAKAIADGHAAVGTMLSTQEGRQTLAEEFAVTEGADWLADRKNARAFCGEGVAYFPAQGNDPASTAPSSNIATICEVMVNETIGDEVDRLAAVARQQRNAKGKSLYEESRADADDLPDFWGWQTCTEFGFYQTCRVGSACFFTQGLDTLDDEESFCESEFGISPDLIAENVAQSNTRYGSDHPEGTRVLWVNGEVDPWHGLSVLKTLSPSMPAIWVPGASHHAWTHPTLPTDQKTVIDARKKIREQVRAWLQGPSRL